MSWPTQQPQQQQQHQQQYHQVLATPPPPPPSPRPQTPPSRRIHTIVENNRKTEMCRNWDKGICRYGERCAFAHGMGELKYRTLREMQNAGRIPDAAKYRCYPCMTWVATGSCPYASRCVFIHDPRVRGPIEAYLYARGHARSPSSAYPSSDSSFFFPDVPRDPDSYELPADLCLYDLDPSMSRSPHQSDRAVYNLWYSFVSMLEEDAVPMDKDGSLEDQERHTGKDRGLNGHQRQISSLSLSALDDTRIPAHGNDVEADQTLAGTGVTTTTTWPDYGYAPSLRLSSSGSAATSTNETNSRAPESRIPRDFVRHLPVFSALRRGIPAAPLTPPSPALQIGVPLGPLIAVKPRDNTKPYGEAAIDADHRISDGEDSPTAPLFSISPEGPRENLQPAQVRGMTARLPSSVDCVVAPPPERLPGADRSYESGGGYYQDHNNSLDLVRMMATVPDLFSPLSERFLNGRAASKGFFKGEAAGLGDTIIGGNPMRRGYVGSRCEHLKHHCVGAFRGW